MKVFTNKGHDLSVCEMSERAARALHCLIASTFPSLVSTHSKLADGMVWVMAWSAALPSGHSGYNQPVLGKDGLHGFVRAGGGTFLLPDTIQTR